MKKQTNLERRLNILSAGLFLFAGVCSIISYIMGRQLFNLGLGIACSCLAITYTLISIKRTKNEE